MVRGFSFKGSTALTVTIGFAVLFSFTNFSLCFGAEENPNFNHSPTTNFEIGSASPSTLVDLEEEKEKVSSHVPVASVRVKRQGAEAKTGLKVRGMTSTQEAQNLNINARNSGQSRRKRSLYKQFLNGGSRGRHYKSSSSSYGPSSFYSSSYSTLPSTNAESLKPYRSHTDDFENYSELLGSSSRIVQGTLNSYGNVYRGTKNFDNYDKPQSSYQSVSSPSNSYGVGSGQSQSQGQVPIAPSVSSQYRPVASPVSSSSASASLSSSSVSSPSASSFSSPASALSLSSPPTALSFSLSSSSSSSSAPSQLSLVSPVSGSSSNNFTGNFITSTRTQQRFAIINQNLVEAVKYKESFRRNSVILGNLVLNPDGVTCDDLCEDDDISVTHGLIGLCTGRYCKCHVQLVRSRKNYRQEECPLGNVFDPTKVQCDIPQNTVLCSDDPVPRINILNGTPRRTISPARIPLVPLIILQPQQQQQQFVVAPQPVVLLRTVQNLQPQPQSQQQFIVPNLQQSSFNGPDLQHQQEHEQNLQQHLQLQPPPLQNNNILNSN